MGKLRLDVEHLRVESFDTSAAPGAARGTVRGNVDFAAAGHDMAGNFQNQLHLTGSTCLCTISCDGSCVQTCGGDSCTGPCYSCVPTGCGRTCPVELCDPAPSYGC